MNAKDKAAQVLGIEVIDVALGYSKLRMTIRDYMLNGLGSCHGGLIFSLADTAFAHACNSQNVVTVASSCQIEFLTPGRVGETLEAEAMVKAQRGKVGVYDVAVRDGTGNLIALFRGKSHCIGGALLP